MRRPNLRGVRACAQDDYTFFLSLFPKRRRDARGEGGNHQGARAHHTQTHKYTGARQISCAGRRALSAGLGGRGRAAGALRLLGRGGRASGRVRAGLRAVPPPAFAARQPPAGGVSSSEAQPTCSLLRRAGPGPIQAPSAWRGRPEPGCIEMLTPGLKKVVAALYCAPWSDHF
ncbi:uncharacterized protein [Notamacropus eugenii]|uniref:uncharacterized protein isoform X2 n=1 Tax=Notamacropus eugenii TaxID=9315 RepID=UPI003B677982